MPESDSSRRSRLSGLSQRKSGPEDEPPVADFPPTDWSIVLRDDRSSGSALERLCRLYWQPVYGFIRSHGYTRDDALDLAQDFFAVLLASERFTDLQSHRGHFRSWLLASLRYFLAHRRQPGSASRYTRRAEWLDPGQAEELDLLATTQLDPERAYERAWALGILRRAMAELEAECAARNRGELFEALRPYLPGPGSPDTDHWSGLGAKLGVRDSALRVALVRLRHRFADLVRKEIANALPTWDDATTIDDEMQTLAAALTG